MRHAKLNPSVLFRWNKWEFLSFLVFINTNIEFQQHHITDMQDIMSSTETKLKQFNLDWDTKSDIKSKR